MKGKPYFITSVILGVIFITILGIATVSFLMNSSTVATAVCSLLHAEPHSINNGKIAACSLVFALPSFILAYKAMLDNNTDDEVLPESFEED